MHKNVSWPSLLLGVVGCRIDRATKPAPSDLAFTIAVSRATLRAGEPDTIVVSAANLTADSMVITFPHGCQVLPYIRDGQGRAVLPPGGNWLCTTVISQLRLGPRQVKEYRGGGHRAALRLQAAPRSWEGGLGDRWHHECHLRPVRRLLVPASRCTGSTVRRLPNKRLKLAGALVLGEAVVSCPGGHGTFVHSSCAGGRVARSVSASR